MTTRLESFAKELDGGAPSQQTDAITTSRRARRLIWDVSLGLFAAVYVALVLFDDVESPLLSLVLVVVVACELIEPHLRGQ